MDLSEDSQQILAEQDASCILRLRSGGGQEQKKRHREKTISWADAYALYPRSDFVLESSQAIWDNTVSLGFVQPQN